VATKHEPAVRYVLDFLNSLVPEATVRLRPDARFIIDVGGEYEEVWFSEAEMEDFEMALERFQGTNYFHTLENRIRFRVFVALGSKGLIPKIRISDQLLQEKGEWLKTVHTDVEFDGEFSKALYEGLGILSKSIELKLASGLTLPEVQKEKRVVESLRGYYEDKGHLNSTGAGLESLSYLKAAAVCILMAKEKSRAAVNIPRLRKALDAEIYGLVARIRDEPFLDIKLPEAIHDYAIQQGGTTTAKTPTYVRETTTDEQQDRLDKLLERLDPRLAKRRKGAWDVLRSANPDRLSQAANSMVELLDQVIGQTCAGQPLPDFLKVQYETHEETAWIEATRKWISQTKSNLHRVKHHVEYKDERLAEALLTNAETIMVVLLEARTAS
jgi:hypothetical protein